MRSIKLFFAVLLVIGLTGSVTTDVFCQTGHPKPPAPPPPPAKPNLHRTHLHHPHVKGISPPKHTLPPPPPPAPPHH